LLSIVFKRSFGFLNCSFIEFNSLNLLLIYSSALHHKQLQYVLHPQLLPFHE
jgi:hypothetical protein